MHWKFSKSLILLAGGLTLAGCATSPRQLMPTPLLYRQPGGVPVFSEPVNQRGTDLEFLFITDRGPERTSRGEIPYGQVRAKWISFGSAAVRLTPPITFCSAAATRSANCARRTCRPAARPISRPWAGST